MDEYEYFETLLKPLVSRCSLLLTAFSAGEINTIMNVKFLFFRSIIMLSNPVSIEFKSIHPYDEQHAAGACGAGYTILCIHVYLT